MKGERLQGFFGPVFLLMPLALFSLRRRAGRRLLLAGAVFALPWLLNIGSRFLIPALAPLTLALALAVERPTWFLPAVMVLHGVLSWYAPPVRYFDRYAPRLDAVPLRAALRIEAEDAYLARSNTGYLIDRMIERQVPSGNRVFSFEPIPEAWTTREIVAAQNGAENEVTADILRTALISSACPIQTLDFRFSPTLITACARDPDSPVAWRDVECLGASITGRRKAAGRRRKVASECESESLGRPACV